MKARSYHITAPSRGQLIEHEIRDPGPGQLLLRVLSNGVCASDLPTWTQASRTTPLLLGHEPVGEVIATGPGVQVPLGTLVGGRIFPSYAEVAVADFEDVVVIPPGIDPAAVLPEPLGCVAEGLRRTPVPLGAHVAVIGLGFMGLVMLQLLRNAGVASLMAIDPRADARDAAIASGADDARPADQLSVTSFVDEDSPPDHGFDVVVEASGSQPGLDLATRLVRPHGALSILGFHQTNRQIDLRTWNWKALDVVNAHVRDRALLKASTVAALELQAAGRIDPGRLITHRFPMESVDEAFAALASKPAGFIKAVIDIGSPSA
ncbi:zinc-binding dehydrogenase [Phytoactinopolyspora alkaliphila]|uniref:Zinc-binding dehydrogenase n=1 Tax=Phytoactinopolyspora alkaliphila TaxID=1783498 RepID=A0A6N9YPJ8_9ACTN|nr:zinc-binding dehydrogenase [Phytoactinopolyspora alkaliphila]NED96877.1 zinc-binding dehydrogenase [Phytoactinopolyspora alkaliphila]